MWQYNYIDTMDDELYHHGILGMKWGIRRYQNANGTLTPAGRKKQAKMYTKDMNNLTRISDEYASDLMRSSHKLKKVANKSANPDKDPKVKKLTEKTLSDSAKLKASESEIWKKYGKIASEGYVVNSKDIVRSCKKGEQYLSAFLGGAPGVLALLGTTQIAYGKEFVATVGGVEFPQTPYAVATKKYKVYS